MTGSAAAAVATNATGGEVAVIGLGRSGRAAASLLASRGVKVYASDAGRSEELEQAARVLAAQSIAVEVGRHDIPRIRNALRVVVSPGIPPDAEPIAAARAASVPIVSEIALALEFASGLHVIAVTGTNGKSTTAALIAHLLDAIGHRAAVAGNIGVPLSEIVAAPQCPDWIALEISSFQLHDTPSLNVDVGVLTNLAPDHLDRYASVDDYYADKRLLFAGARDNSAWVLNGDDHAAFVLARGAAGRVYEFSLRRRPDAWFDEPTGSLVLFGEPLATRDDVPLFGAHNVANALAAVLAVAVALPENASNDARRRIVAGLRSFRALPHRLELIAERNGVQWINDSKATNVASAKAAIESMSRPTVLLLGGRHKGQSYASLAGAVRKHVRHVIAYGEAAPLISGDLRGAAPELDELGLDFAAVVARARDVARQGDAVLLSPACSSFDMFRDYEERGARFRALAEAA